MVDVSAETSLGLSNLSEKAAPISGGVNTDCQGEADLPPTANADVVSGALSSDSLTGYAATAWARVLFYPSLAYNIARSTIQPEYRWYTEVVENLLLGALPFHSMLDDFKEQGIRAVVTLNEDFELFVTSEHYKEMGIEHLHLPTVDFLFAPGVEDMLRAVSFMQEHLQQGHRTYVHCKAGRGRSATVVVCFMVKCHHMTPEEAVAYVRDKRPQISLASGQWAAVLNFYKAYCDPPAEESGDGDVLTAAEEAGGCHPELEEPET